MSRDIIGDDPDALLRAIVSGDLEIGDDGGEIGAVPSRLRNLRQGRVPPKMPSGKGADPAKWRRLPCPLPQTSIATGATAQVTATPQRLFRANFLIATESVANKQFIDGVTVQGENQFVAAGSIPVAAFGPTVLLNNEMQLRTCDIGGTITLLVRNTDTITATFTGTFFGEAYID